MKVRNLTVNSSITVLVSLSDHLINLVICQLLTDGGHNMTKLSSGNETIVVAVKDLCRNIGQHISAKIERYAGPQSRTLKASLISSSESVSFIFLAIIVKNSASR